MRRFIEDHVYLTSSSCAFFASSFTEVGLNSMKLANAHHVRSSDLSPGWVPTHVPNCYVYASDSLLCIGGQSVLSRSGTSPEWIELGGMLPVLEVDLFPGLLSGWAFLPTRGRLHCTASGVPLHLEESDVLPCMRVFSSPLPSLPSPVRIEVAFLSLSDEPIAMLRRDFR